MQITFLAVQKVNWQAIAVAKHTYSCPCDPPIREQMHALAQGTFCALGLLAHILIPILITTLSAGKADTAQLREGAYMHWGHIGFREYGPLTCLT